LHEFAEFFSSEIFKDVKIKLFISTNKAIGRQKIFIFSRIIDNNLLLEKEQNIWGKL